MNKQSYTIAFFNSAGIDPFIKELSRGAEAAAKELGIRIIFYMGDEMHIDFRTGNPSNIIYDFTPPHLIDGIVICSNIICHGIGISQAQQKMLSYEPIPVYSIGNHFDSIPSICVNNEEGMYLMVQHLIQDHKCKRLIYLGGPENGQESLERLAGFNKALSDNPDIALILYKEGDFMTPSAIALVKQLLYDLHLIPGKDFDAVICANDTMATGVEKEFLNEGYHAPTDLKITGFDDTILGRSIQPKLSTVAIPTFYLAYNAIKQITEWIKTGNRPDDVVLPSILQPRASCGCESITPQDRHNQNTQIKLSFFEQIKLHLSSYLITNSLLIDESNLNTLTSAFLNELEHKKHIEIEVAMQKCLKSTDYGLVNDEQWIKILDHIRFLIVDLGNYQKPLVDLIFYKAAFQIKEFQLDNYFRTVSSENLSKQRLQQMSKVLLEAYSISNIFECLTLSLPLLGIKHCLISLYETDNNYATLKYYLDNSVQIDTSSESSFPSKNLTPSLKHISNNTPLTLIPLFFGSRQIGIMLYDIINEDRELPHQLQLYISSAISRALINNDLEQHQEHLEELVINRTADLVELQKREIENAHRAGMVNIVNNALHNVGNLINSINISAESLEKSIENPVDRKLGKAIDMLNLIQHNNNALSAEKRSALFEYINQLKINITTLKSTSLNQIERIKEKTKDIMYVIRNEQKYAGDVQLNQQIDFSDLVLEALAVTSHQHITTQTTIVKKLEPVLISCQIKKMMFIIICLLNNAEEAIFKSNNKGKGHIKLLLQQKNNQAILQIIDNGNGIEKDKLTTVFNQGYTTKTSEKGYSLHSCANYMTEMKGSLQAFSNGLETGATFTISLPIDSEISHS